MTEDLDGLYNPRILELAKTVEHDHRLEVPDRVCSAVSPLCGSRLRFDVRLDGERIAALGWQVRACALGQCSAALMVRHAPGATGGILEVIHGAVEAMLAGEAYTLAGEWRDYELLSPARDFPARHGSILLPFQALRSLSTPTL